MSEKEFNVFTGKFNCQKCKEEVTTLRMWKTTGDLTWMCSKKHVSRVALIQKKRKKSDFINE